jgi:hypothetical protein
LSAETAPAPDDELLLYDLSATAADKITLVNLLKVINALTEDTAPSNTADFVVTYDVSAGAVKKVLPKYLGSFGSQLLHVRDEKPSGTNGGTFVQLTRVTRTLNTIKTNEIAGAALSSNQVSGLTAGTYHVRARAPARGVGGHALFVHNVTASVDLLIGSASRADSSDNGDAWLEGRFTLGTTSAIELQHICHTTNADDGLGQGNSLGTEVFAELWLWKVA